MILLAVSIACVSASSAGLAIRYWGEPYAVCQVFKLLKSVPLAGGNYIGVYDVALTPGDPGKEVAYNHVVTMTPEKYVDLLEKKVWLLPPDLSQYAYCETPLSRRFMYLGLAAGILLWVVSFFLFRRKEE